LLVCESKFGILKNAEDERPNVELPLISAIIRAKSNSTPLNDSDWWTFKELTHQSTKEQQSPLEIFTSTAIDPLPDSFEDAPSPQVPEGLIDKFNNLKNIEDEFSKISPASQYIQELITAAEGKGQSKSKKYKKYTKIIQKLQTL
jgi:hypothetical protein